MSTPHPEAERLTLAALPAEHSDPEVAAHLRRCAQCRAEVDALRRTVELARAEGVGEPLPIPPTRVWQAILDEIADDPAGAGTAQGRDGQVGHRPAVAEAADRSGSDRGSENESGGGTGSRSDSGSGEGPLRTGPVAPRRDIPWWRRRLVGVAAAGVVGLGLGVGVSAGVSGSGDKPEPVPAVQLGPVGFADPTATGTAAMVDHDGDRRMVVELRGVTNLAGGDYLEAWLMDSTGSRLLPLGALARHGEEFRGEFTIPAGLPAGEYDRVDVSAERFDGDPGHSTVSLLRGDLA
jgi:Anti-sigma-K factor rskA, C-terminal